MLMGPLIDGQTRHSSGCVISMRQTLMGPLIIDGQIRRSSGCVISMRQTFSHYFQSMRSSVRSTPPPLLLGQTPTSYLARKLPAAATPTTAVFHAQNLNIAPPNVYEACPFFFIVGIAPGG